MLTSSYFMKAKIWKLLESRSRQPNREERLNRAGIELWNSPALSKCIWLYLVYQETKSKVPLRGAWGPELSSVEPYLGNAIGVVGIKKKIWKLFAETFHFCLCGS